MGPWGDESEEEYLNDEGLNYEDMDNSWLGQDNPDLRDNNDD